MDLDRIFHEQKHFAELEDGDIETFLRERKFRREHLNLEFKSEFNQRSGGNFKIRDICKYIVGFSNEEGGAVIYGVEDSIKDEGVAFPDYVTGLQSQPSIEDLSQWVTERISPLVQSPAIREFSVTGKSVVILKIPSGQNRPYCYYNPGTRSLCFYKKTAGGIKELSPDEVRDLYWDAILDQSQRILRAQLGVEANPKTENDRLSQHREAVVSKLEDPEGFGRLSMYCVPKEPVDIPVATLREFINSNRGHFSEALRFFPTIEPLQKGVTVGYFPRAIRQDIKSTLRVTLHQDGLIAFDAHADTTMDRDQDLHPYWLTYEIQRHLQLAKAVLKDANVEKIKFILELENIDEFVMRFSNRGHVFLDKTESRYTGSHEPIEKTIDLNSIHDFDGEKRNIVMPIVKEIIDEVCRIFGFSGALPGIWDENDYLNYVKGLEHQR